MNAKIKDFFAVDAVEKQAAALAKEVRNFQSAQFILIKTAHFVDSSELQTIATDYLFFADKKTFSQYEKANPQRFKDFADLKDFLLPLLIFEKQCALFLRNADFPQNQKCQSAVVSLCKNSKGEFEIEPVAVFDANKEIANFIECVLMGGKEFEAAALIEILQKTMQKQWLDRHADFEHGIQNEKSNFEKIILDVGYQIDNE